MTTRCKFKCNGVRKSVSHYPQNDEKFQYEADFSAVQAGSEENDKFFQFTPNGSMKVSTYTDDVFIPGEEYFIDITHSPKEESKD